METPKIIAVDFDGTLCDRKYPEIGAPHNDVISIVKKLKAAGNVLILYTCRRDEYLTAAIDWCAAHGITFDYINENAPQIIEQYGSDTRKISADLYIDDKAINPHSTFAALIDIYYGYAAVARPFIDLLKTADTPDEGGGNVKV